MAGFAAVWGVDGAGRAAERQTTAFDVSALAAQCDSAESCSAFSSEGEQRSSSTQLPAP